MNAFRIVLCLLMFAVTNNIGFGEWTQHQRVYSNVVVIFKTCGMLFWLHPPLGHLIHYATKRLIREGTCTACICCLACAKTPSINETPAQTTSLSIWCPCPKLCDPCCKLQRWEQQGVKGELALQFSWPLTSPSGPDYIQATPEPRGTWASLWRKITLICPTHLTTTNQTL